MDSGTIASMHMNCHHQLIYAKFNLKIFYPPPYEREIWHYGKANTELINRTVTNFNWENALERKFVDAQVSAFNEVFLNIMRNYIPHETIICDDRDPPWINKFIKKLITETNMVFKSLMSSKRNLFLRQKFNAIQEKLTMKIETAKQE